MKAKNTGRTIVPYFVLFIVIMIILYMFNTLNVKINDMSYNTFNKQLENDKVNIRIMNILN